MGLSAKQIQALRRNPCSRNIRTREVNGRQLSYIEGWFAISEANRIFGFDGWSRETVESRCVLARENRGAFTAVYTAKVRVAVQAGDTVIVREGHGTGEGRSGTAGEVHDVAIKAAETDATKRALATFGRPFGLELYRGGKPASAPASIQANSEATAKLRPAEIQIDSASSSAAALPTNTPSLPTRERYLGPRTRTVALMHNAEKRATEVFLSPSEQDHFPRGKIDKSALAFGEPKRLRDKDHLKFVGSQPCLVCGRRPSDAHHLRFAQPRALGLKVSDEFTVPLCRGHHREVHRIGNEPAWWEDLEINALEIAKGLWEQSRGIGSPSLNIDQAPGTVAAPEVQRDAHFESRSIK